MTTGNWTDTEIAEAVRLRNLGRSYQQIGVALNRPWDSVRKKLDWQRMSEEQRQARRDVWNAAGRNRRRAASLKRAPRAVNPEGYRGQIWHGRCPSFRPTYDERRGRMAHAAD